VWDTGPSVEPQEAAAPKAPADLWGDVWDTGPSVEPQEAAAPKAPADLWGDVWASEEPARKPGDEQPEAAKQPKSGASQILEDISGTVSKLTVLERMRLDNVTVMEISLDELKAQIEAERVRRPVST
jgi:hypothetical protein